VADLGFFNWQASAEARGSTRRMRRGVTWGTSPTEGDVWGGAVSPSQKIGSDALK